MPAILLPTEWAEYLHGRPETGMDYYVGRVTLYDGREYGQVAVQGGLIVQVRGFRDIPFSTGEISEIEVNHKKWNFREKR
jgi:hypothetical protein